MRTRILPLAASASALALALTACSAADSTPAKDAKASTAGTATTQAAKTDYNPQPYDKIKEGGTYTTTPGLDDQGNPFSMKSSAFFSAPVWFWYNPDVITFSPTGEAQYNPDYLSDVKVSTVEGHQRVVLSLNPKAVYNDGTPIDWTAVKATWQANNGSDKKFEAARPQEYATITSVTKGTDAKQAVIDFKGSVPWWPKLFTTFLHPKAATPEAFNNGYFRKAHPEWGAGPYTIDRFDAKAGSVSFARNPKWWGKKGKLDHRVMLRNLDPAATRNAFRNGELDMARASTTEELKQISGVRGGDVRTGASPFVSSLHISAKSPRLKDIQVRKALVESIDRSLLAKIQFQGLGYTEPLSGSALFYPFQKGYSDNVGAVVTYDPENAKKILDAAGWKPGADGVRAKNGVKLDLQYTMLAGDVMEKAQANATAAMLKPVGIHLTIRKADNTTFEKVLVKHEFDLFVMGDRSLDPYGSQSLARTYGLNGTGNYSGTGSAALDAQIAAVSEGTDLTEQVARANAAERKALSEYGFLPLNSGPSIYGVPKKLANVGASIFATPLPETIGWTK